MIKVRVTSQGTLNAILTVGNYVNGCYRIHQRIGARLYTVLFNTSGEGRAVPANRFDLLPKIEALLHANDWAV